MEYISFIPNLILAVLTGFYVFLTYKLVNESRNANEINRRFTEEQVRLMTSPYIHCSISNKDEELYISLTNSSPVPAYDVDIWITGMYAFDEIKELIKESSDGNVIYEEDFVYSKDRIIYPIFPNGYQVNAKLKFPIITDSLNVFIQYRDSKAENYSYDVWFIDDSDGSRKSYQIGAINPIGNFSAVRFDTFEDLKEYDSKKYPKHIDDFVNRYKNVAYLKVPNNNEYFVEDRGEWKLIK